ncbi:MAG: beta-mannosidase [Bacteroidales bacterium]|nr:beta-mannosidase [Bacteroidales bacterium]
MNNIKSSILIILSTLILAASCTVQNNYYRVENGSFIKGEKPYYFIGTNFWYGAILSSEGEGGNRERLNKELDYLKFLGINNLRILVGSDGERGVNSKVEPTLQLSPGHYNDTIFRGLDYLMVELNKRDMCAVLYLNNSWEWSGGYGKYLEWAGYGKAPIPNIDGGEAFMQFVTQYHKSDSAKVLFNQYIKDVISRKNTITGKPYSEDPAIFSWQICNEPRAFAEENKESFTKWIWETAKLIKQLDPNHMVSTGSEGKNGCEGDISLFEKIHSCSEIDYLNIHIWPYNWLWISKTTMIEDLDSAIFKTKEYMEEHLPASKKLGKPIVIEEFGFPRDNFKFGINTPTKSRDIYYEYLTDVICKNAEEKGLIAGCNFWGWGGFAKPSTEHIFWIKGDAYTGDPAQEQQGLNSVFATDSTTNIIKKATEKIKNLYNY